MLTRLFSSQTRVELLRLFLSNPEKRYYLRQIARLLTRDISGIKRELDNLERAGLLTSDKVGNLRYYAVNKTASIYPELKSIIAKTVGMQASIGTGLASLRGLRKVWLYSTNAHAPGESGGPIPVLIVGDVDLRELNETITRLEEQLGNEINYTVFDEAEFDRRRAEGDPFLSEVLSGRTVLLIERADGV